MAHDVVGGPVARILHENLERIPLIARLTRFPRYQGIGVAGVDVACAPSGIR